MEDLVLATTTLREVREGWGTRIVSGGKEDRRSIAVKASVISPPPSQSVRRLLALSPRATSCGSRELRPPMPSSPYLEREASFPALHSPRFGREAVLPAVRSLCVRRGGASAAVRSRAAVP